MIKVLIIEDELIVAKNIENLLVDNKYIVTGIADRFEKALVVFEENAPDLVLCDVKIKGEKTGIDLAAELRKKHSFKLIYLTAYNDEPLLMQAARTEPDSFLLKPYTEPQLLASIKMLFSDSKQNMSVGLRDKIKRFEELSLREKEIIQKLAEGKNSKQIGTELFISPHTVDTHRRHILLKMDCSNSIELVVFVIENKLL